MSKGLKIGLGVGLVVLLLVVLYFVFRSGSKKGDKPYVDLPAGDAYNAFYSALVGIGFSNPSGYDGKQYTPEELSRGYLKKNGLAMTAANVNTYSSEIKAYVNAPGSKPHYQL